MRRTTVCLLPLLFGVLGCQPAVAPRSVNGPVTLATAPSEASAAASSTSEPTPPTGEPVPVPAPAIEETSVESAPADAEVTLTLADYDGIQELVAGKQGKVVVLDAWSTWCEPCMKEFPGLVRLHEQHGPEKVACISVNCNYEGIDSPEEPRAEVLAFLTKQQAAFDNILASEDSETMFKKLGIPSIPAVFVYDQEGKLAKKFDSNSGKFTYEDVGELVERLVADGE